jgi:hypothetical protein
MMDDDGEPFPPRPFWAASYPICVGDLHRNEPPAGGDHQKGPKYPNWGAPTVSPQRLSLGSRAWFVSVSRTPHPNLQRAPALRPDYPSRSLRCSELVPVRIQLSGDPNKRPHCRKFELFSLFSPIFFFLSALYRLPGFSLTVTTIANRHSSRRMEPASIRCLAEKILEECSFIEKACQAKGTVLPTASAAGTSNATLETSDAQPELITSREKALGLLVQLTSLLHGPHDFLHEFVASNWDHGALYVFLQSKTLDHIASSPEQRSSVSRLSRHSGIPEDKLTRILALLRCRGIVDEPESGIFSLTPVSEDLIHHRDFRAWVEFQYAPRRYPCLQDFIVNIHASDSSRRVLPVLTWLTHYSRGRMTTPTAPRGLNRGGCQPCECGPFSCIVGANCSPGGELRCTTGMPLTETRGTASVKP